MRAGRYGRASSQTAALARRMLGEIADRFEANRPDEVLTATGRLAALQATTMDATLSRALRELAPEVEGEITRSAYAARLRQIAGAS